MLVYRINALFDFEFFVRIALESHSGGAEVRHQFSPLLPPNGTFCHCYLILLFCIRLSSTLDMELCMCF